MKQTDYMTEQLAKIGVSVRINHYTGDNSYPTEYTISHPNGPSAVGPTFDVALVDFIAQLLKTSSNLRGK